MINVDYISFLRGKSGYWISLDDSNGDPIWTIIESNFKRLMKAIREAGVPDRVRVQLSERYMAKRRYSDSFIPVENFKVKSNLKRK